MLFLPKSSYFQGQAESAGDKGMQWGCPMSPHERCSYLGDLRWDFLIKEEKQPRWGQVKSVCPVLTLSVCFPRQHLSFQLS